MTYEIDFYEDAFEEWRKLDASVREQLKKKLAKLKEDPHRPGNLLRGLDGCYKIKLRAAGVRLVYKVEDDELIILVVAVGKRDKNAVYDSTRERLSSANK
ncbi:type II toxin-antitoxin system RelE/ParE family toxin [Enterobacteriaceae bacterium H11S18]|uniref:type II toxin-antitoxin system RelE family toxin n=1 Tax=Dryocola clanedunensis TaxID=2925396 RepID=UPI0022F03928|nr:type II toxin-antitoxin system RelE/ParE family toxin [Dryocola clanedunensis]MCT4709178.1 type II toxin-antitoxin system RelE/ParE family toxin [Dryocola clanedunensis]